jgi:hypothetical protein
VMGDVTARPFLPLSFAALACRVSLPSLPCVCRGRWGPCRPGELAQHTQTATHKEHNTRRTRKRNAGGIKGRRTSVGGATTAAPVFSIFRRCKKGKAGRLKSLRADRSRAGAQSR